MNVRTFELLRVFICSCVDGTYITHIDLAYHHVIKVLVAYHSSVYCCLLDTFLLSTITCIWPRTKLISFSCSGSQFILELSGRTCVLAVGYYTSFNAYLLCAWCTSFFVITSTVFLKIIKAYILWENNPRNAGVHNKVAFFIDGLREMQLEDRYYGIWETQLDWRQTFCYFASKGFYSLIWNICDTVFQWG